MNFYETTITQEGIDNVVACLKSNHISAGKQVAILESKLLSEFGYDNCVAVNSGTSALHLALRVLGIREGDEVIIPAQTFVATGLAVLYCGAKPVFADIDVLTGNLYSKSVESKITEKTKAIIFVSWGGNLCNLTSVSEVCRKHGVFLIHDAAHTFGMSSQYLDFCNATCFSFQAIKTLVAGDGGAVSFKDNEKYHLAKRLAWFGIDRNNDLEDWTGERQYNLRDVGYKYHMNDLVASLVLGNLKAVPFVLKIRQAIARFYDNEIDLSMTTDYLKDSPNWLYTILVSRQKDFMQMMKSNDIPVSVVHVGIDRNAIFSGINRELETQRYWDEHHVCLPINSKMTLDDVEKVVATIKKGW